MSRYRDLYQNEIVAAMTKKFGYKNAMQVPKLDKIVVNMAVGEAKENAKVLENAANDMTIITGQKPVYTKAKKSIANFKIREGMPIGCKVTLRGEKMYEFLDRLVNLALPRVRDFRGVSANSFDGRGNYALGIKEQLIFPEIEYDKIDKTRGMDIIFTTTAKTDEEARELLRLFNMPFANCLGGKKEHGKVIHEAQTADEAEVLYKGLYPLQNLRSSAFGSQKIWNLQNLLP